MIHPTALPSALTWQWIRLILAAFLAGVLNAVAGGGSFLSFPAIYGMGILPIQANATNTVAVWPGQLTSIAGYRHDVRRNLAIVWPMGLVGLAGGTAGALILLHTPQMTFLHLVPWLLLLAAGIFAFSGPINRAIQRRRGAIVAGGRHPHLVPLLIGALAVCFYIGYFGAGAGFLLISLMGLFGFDDLHQINAIKVVTTTLANGVAFLLFVLNGQVVWRYCLAAMVVCGIGGYASATVARRIPQSLLRWAVVVIGLAMAAWFFWKNA
jgi:uncharacterized membrane protein YfcA